MAEKKKNPFKGKGKGPQNIFKKAVPKLLRFAVGISIPVHLALPFLAFPPAEDFYLAHLTYPIAPLAIIITMLGYSMSSHSRTHPPKDKRGKPRREAKPPRKALGQVLKDATDIIANLDNAAWRIFYFLGFIAVVALPIRYPISVDAVKDLGDDTQLLLFSAGLPILLVIIMVSRIASIMRKRMDWVEEIYAIARDSFEYKPLPRTGQVSKRQRVTATPHLAVDVRKWKTLTEGDTFFVWVPEKLSATDVKTWDEFTANLEEKAPRSEEWRVQTTGHHGRGALVGPANYPRAVLWDGEYHSDPLTFTLGVNLETGEPYTLTFNDTSPHMAASGGTSTGKTSAAEIIAAQALVKPMPWDKDLHGQVHFVDPKGPLARRWQGRPGVVVSNGQADSDVDAALFNEDGDEISPFTGIMVMAQHMDHIEQEHKRRADILARYPDVGTWMALSDEVKRKERFFPIFIALDEYLDHTDLEKVRDAGRIEAEDAARQATTRMAAWHARKYRNVGMHTILIAQEVKMTGNTGIGSNLMRNLPIRLITGQMDRSQIETMFGTTEIPRLPSSYRKDNGEVKTIPGRARIMNALGQSIYKIQVMYFGGPSNSDTLDKWLPRGEKPLNGDFALPTGTRPRCAADFDEEGNLIEEATTAASADDGEARADENHASTKASPGAEVPEETPATEAAEEAPEDAPAPEESATSTQEKAADPEEEPGIFTATPSANSCTECATESTWSCPECSTRYCTAHGTRTRNPDPDSKNRFVCGSCAAKNPLVAVGLATILPEVINKARRLRLAHEYAVKEDEDGPYGELRIRSGEGGKKIIEVYSRPKEGSPDGGFAYNARSSSGSVEGLSQVEERIDVAIKTYVRKRQEKTEGAAS